MNTYSTQALLPSIHPSPLPFFLPFSLTLQHTLLPSPPPLLIINSLYPSLPYPTHPYQSIPSIPYLTIHLPIIPLRTATIITLKLKSEGKSSADTDTKRHHLVQKWVGEEEEKKAGRGGGGGGRVCMFSIRARYVVGKVEMNMDASKV